MVSEKSSASKPDPQEEIRTVVMLRGRKQGQPIDPGKGSLRSYDSLRIGVSLRELGLKERYMLISISVRNPFDRRRLTM